MMGGEICVRKIDRWIDRKREKEIERKRERESERKRVFVSVSC